MTIFILSKLDVVIYCFKAARKPSYKCRYFVEELRNEQPTDFVITCSFLFGCYGLFLFFFPDVKASKCLLVKHIDLYRFCSVVANVITYFRVCICCFFLRHSFCLWNLGKPSFNFLHISHVNVTWGIAIVPILFGNWRRHRKKFNLNLQPIKKWNVS